MPKNREIKFLRHDGTAFALVGNIIDMDDFTPSREVEEETNYGVESGSDAADAKEYVRGLMDGGELTVTTKYKETNNEGAQAMEDEFYASGEGKNDYQIHLPTKDKKSLEFTAIITSCGRPLAAGEDLKQVFKLKISGKPKWGNWS